jgi:hypothetical protein
MALRQEIIDQFTDKTGLALFMMQPIHLMNREELLAVVGYLMKTLDAEREENQKRQRFASDLLKR